MSSNINSNIPLDINTRIGNSSLLRGNINFKTSLKLEGILYGSIKGNLLYISKSGKIEGQIDVSNLYTEGKVLGDIKTKERLNIMASSEIVGNIKANLIKIEEGAIFDGRCETIENVESIDIFSQSITELRNLLR